MPANLQSTCYLTALMLLPAAGHTTQVTKNPDNGLLSYKNEENGFSIELIEVVPDFIRAVYGGHNFPASVIEDIASYCVYGSVIKNTSDKPLNYRVADWYYVLDGKRHPVKTKTEWLDEWKKSGIIFSWTLLPDHGEFFEGDWQQGFTTIKAPRNSRFDLHYNWTLDDVKHEAVLKNMQCPPEKVPVQP